MIDLSRITSDGGQAVYIRTINQARELITAVREQRPDISVKAWSEEISGTMYYDTCYILSYCGCKSLKRGSKSFLTSQNIQVLEFEDLLAIEIPEFEASEHDVSFLIGE